MSERNIRIYKYLTGAIFVLVALGGAVRAMNAGLACPDWPLCFGDIIPDYHPQVYFEFIHRALAGIIGIVSVYLNVQILRASSASFAKGVKFAAGLAIVLLLAQVVMGGLTVLLQLHEKVVALHLAMGTGFFALSYWIYLAVSQQDQIPSKDSPSRAEASHDAESGNGVASVRAVKNASYFLLAAVYGQILLGGLVASHYAALVCTDFPLCHGEFMPTFHGIIGLHVIHRLGAYLLTVIVISYAIYLFKKTRNANLRRLGVWAVVLLAVQIGIGISNVVFHTPPLITVLHLAAGTALFGLAVKLVSLSSHLSKAD